MREAFRRLPREESEHFVKQALKSMGFEGNGTVAYPDPQPLETTFWYEVRFHASEALNLPGSGAFWISSWIPVPINLGSISHEAVDRSPAVDAKCSAGILVEHYDLALPTAAQILSMPEGVHVESPPVRYDSRYRMDERHHLMAERRYEDLSEGPVCVAETVALWRSAMKPIWRDVRQQLLYRQQ
jgi:hypothetical protein